MVDEVFINICYNAQTRTLAAATDKGKLVFFRSKFEDLIPKSEQHWDITQI